MNWQKSSTTIVLSAIIVLMGAEIIYLVYQNRQLKQMLNDPARFFEKTLQSGDAVPALRGPDINGTEISLTYDTGSPYTLALWFSPTCESCEDNFGIWNEIERRRVPEKLRLIGLCGCTAGEGKEAAAAHGIAFPVLAVTDPGIVDMYKGNLLPQTILIEPEGRIRQVWPGALLESQKAEILSLLTTLATIKPEGGE